MVKDMATMNTVPCPQCREEIFEPEDIDDWEPDYMEDGLTYYDGEADVTCPHCGAVVTMTYGGRAVGHPDVGNPVEDIELVDIELKDHGVPDFGVHWDRVDGDSLLTIPYPNSQGLLFVHELDGPGVVHIHDMVAEGDALLERIDTIGIRSPLGPPDVQAFEPVTILDDGVVTLPLVRDGVVRADLDSIIQDPNERRGDDMATYTARAVSLRSCLT